MGLGHDRPISYEERDSLPGEQDRGNVLEALAAGQPWVFIIANLSGDGVSLKLEQDDRMDLNTVKALLQRTLGALPGGE